MAAVHVTLNLFQGPDPAGWMLKPVQHDVIPAELNSYICAYARNRSEAFANRRAGANPLVIRAKGRGPSASRADVVVTDTDAELLLSEDKQSGFLQDFRVIIIVDR